MHVSLINSYKIVQSNTLRLVMCLFLLNSSIVSAQDAVYSKQMYFEHIPDANKFTYSTARYNIELNNKGVNVKLNKSELDRELEYSYSMKFLTQNELQWEPFGEAAFRSMHYRGNESWESANYERLLAKEVFQNVDVLISQNNGSLKYDIIIGEKGRISDVRFKYDNIVPVLNSSQELVFHMDSTTVTESIPKSYQLINGKEKIVTVKYILSDDNTIGFECIDCIEGAKLVIDPVLEFSTYLGGSDDDLVYGQDIKIDDSGNTWLLGSTFSNDIPVLGNPTQPMYQSGMEMFVAKMNSNGFPLHITYLGGSANDQAESLDIDANGDILILGKSNSDNYPVTSGAFQTIRAGGTDCVITKLSSNGTLLFSSYFGSVENEAPKKIRAHPNGLSFYITGEAGSGLPTTLGCLQPNMAGGNFDAFLSQFDATGVSLLYSTYIGGANGSEQGSDILIEGNNVVISGRTGSNDFPVTNGSYSIVYAGGSYDVFVTSFDASNNHTLNSSTFIGGPGVDYSLSSILLNTGEYLLVGGCGLGYPETVGAFSQSTPYPGGGGGFATIISNDLSTLITSTHIGGSNFLLDFATTAHQTSTGDIFIAGSAGENFPVSDCYLFDTHFPNNSGGQDAFITRFDPTLTNLTFSTFLGGGGAEYAHSMAVSDDGSSIYVSGYTLTDDYIVTSGAFDTTNTMWYRKLFFSKVLIDAYIEGGMTTLTACLGDTLNLNAVGATNPNWSGVYSGSSQSISFEPPLGSSILYLQDSSVCGVLVDTLLIEVYPSPSVDLGNDTMLCTISNYQISSGASNMDYLWSTGATTQDIVVNQEGLYSLIVTDSNNCVVMDSIRIELSGDNFSIDLGSDTSICDGATITLGPISGNNIVWGDNSTDVFFDVSQAGTYYVSADSSDCLASDTIVISVIDELLVNLGNDTSICLFSPIELNMSGLSNYPYDVQWSTGEETDVINVGASGIYTVQVSNECYYYEDTIEVAIINCDCDLFVPNSFTPDEYGSNTTFGPVHDCDLEFYEIFIFNRWGEVIFTTNDINEQWDGTYLSQVQIGSYSYIIKYRLQDGVDDTIYGHVNVLR